MENINKTSIKIDQLSKNFSLSPEYWLSAISVESMGPGVRIEEVVKINKVGRYLIRADDIFVLDTGNAESGLLNLKMHSSSEKTRVSHKKMVPEGSVIISRLRPYLKQVAYIPYGLTGRLGVKEILCSTEFYIFTPQKEDESIAFMVPWLLSNEVQLIFNQAATGGHHPRFDEELLSSLKVPHETFKNRKKTSNLIEKYVQLHLDAQFGMLEVVS